MVTNLSAGDSRAERRGAEGWAGELIRAIVGAWKPGRKGAGAGLARALVKRRGAGRWGIVRPSLAMAAGG